jgi:type VI secretion system protein ImpB
MAESVHEKLKRVRPPRVHITYEVDTGGAIEMKELPFVVGVMADLSGKPDNPLKPLVDRKFTEIDRDNFNQVLNSSTPRVVFKVDNRLQDDGTRFDVNLRFKNLEDFEPENVVKQIDPLRDLLEIRSQLSSLLTKADGNRSLSRHLDEILHNTELQQKISGEGGEAPASNKTDSDPKGGGQ